MDALRTFLEILGTIWGLSIIATILLVASAFWEKLLTVAFGLLIGAGLAYLIIFNTGGFQ